MATTTVNALAPLKAVAHAQSNELFSVLALIESAHDTVERDLPGSKETERVGRLLQVAKEKLDAIQVAFGPYI